MPTVISHAVAAAALIAAVPARAVPRRLMMLGAACSMVPDLDVIGFRLGIGYGDLLGHRGLSHSLAFAAGLASLALPVSRVTPPARRGFVWLYLFLATASHGLLDALTNGGLGVALFSPFDTTRYFFPFTPIEVSPIGARFFSARGLAVLSSEVRWVWLPAMAFAAVAIVARRLFGRSFDVNARPAPP
jgi:inner membrane protein